MCDSASKSWYLREWGASGAPPVVLLHSIATSGAMWSPQVGPWAQYFRLLVVDLPGHGETPPDPRLRSLDDYADRLIEELSMRGIASASIVGLSFGGMIAQACALRHPYWVNAIAIANSLARVPPAARSVWDARIHRAQAGGMASQTADTLARWFTPDFAVQSPVTLKWIQGMIESTSVEGYVIAATAIKQLDYLERLGGVTCRSLVVTGAHDGVATPAVASAMADHFTSATVRIIADAAHLSNVEQPVRFTELVGAFLKDSR